MGKVIAIVNQKGGVAKTTLSVNVGVELGKKKRVLLIDLDPQGSLTDSLGFDPEKVTYSTNSVLEKIIRDEYEYDNSRKQKFLESEGISLLPTNIELAGLEVVLSTVMSRETVLKTYIDEIKNDYDFILLDCSPSLGMLTINALTAADEVIIPVAPEYLAMKGLIQLMNTIAKVRCKLNSTLTIRGIVYTLVDDRTKDSKEKIELINQTYGKEIKIFNTKIPFSVRAKEAVDRGVSITAYEPKGKVAISYMQLTKELLERDNEERKE